MVENLKIINCCYMELQICMFLLWRLILISKCTFFFNYGVQTYRTYKINVDGALLETRGICGVEVNIRDSVGLVMGALSKPFFQICNGLSLELTFLKVVIFYIQLGFTFGEIVTDSSKMASILYNGRPFLGMDCHLVESVKHIFHSVDTFTCSFRYKVQIKQLISCLLFFVFISMYESWMEECLSWLSSILRNDYEI